MQRLTFGSITVDAVSDGVLSCALTGMLPGADPADFRRLGGCEDGETLLLPMLTFVIGSVGKMTVSNWHANVDIAVNPGVEVPANAVAVGLLPQGLARTGIDPATVDAVVFTHLHADHIGWNVTDRNGELVPTFPNAEYIVSKSEWAFWSATESRDHPSGADVATGLVLPTRES